MVIDEIPCCIFCLFSFVVFNEDSTLSFHILDRREKEIELNNARNNFETELKSKIVEAQKTIEVAKSQSSEMEIRKVKERYEQEFKSKEDAQVQLCRDYQERDQAWQLEKQVGILSFVLCKN